MYQINQLSFSYEKKEVLKNISVTFPNNKITAIIGPNGCGKSTLLSHLYRLLPSKDKTSSSWAVIHISNTSAPIVQKM